jgi:uncharacterized membrane protein YGL010W
MKTADTWFAEYGESHRNAVNSAIHFACVPGIMWSVLALLWGWKFSPEAGGLLNAGVAAAAAGLVYYLVLSPPLGMGMLAVTTGMLALCQVLEASLPVPLWQVALAVFVVAWIGQFVGHQIEGKKPSFFQDLQFLLIGPLWVLAKLTRLRAARL